MARSLPLGVSERGALRGASDGVGSLDFVFLSGLVLSSCSSGRFLPSDDGLGASRDVTLERELLGLSKDQK